MEQQIKYHRKTATTEHRKEQKIDDETALADKKKPVLEAAKKAAEESYLSALPKMITNLEKAVQDFVIP